MRGVGPPVRLHLDVSEDHVLDGDGQTGNLPGDVGLPAPPGLGQVLEDGPGLVLLDSLRHHVDNVVHHAGAQLQVEVGLDPLLGDRLGHALAVPPLELPGQQVAQPPLQQRRHAAQEEEPDPPAGSPDPAAGALPDRSGVEAVVDDVLEILAHPDLLHQLVLVPVHAGQLAHVRHGVLQPVRQLEGVHVVESVLHVGVHQQLRQPQDLTTQVERVTESGFLSFLGGQSFDWLQVEIVVQMQVVQILPVDEEVEHVVPLPAHLQSRLHPVQGGGLEKFCRLE